ncbi:DNA mismatch repair protein MutT [Alteromonas sp. KUL42]|nr:DNA mismatch repair protein MutT [Alteromonas sp. KUL42]
MSFFLHLSAILAVLTLFACSPSEPLPPECRTVNMQDLPPNNVNFPLDSEFNAAACVIKTQEQVLLIKNKYSDKLDLPKEKRTNTLSAACIAHRGAWTQTGFNVEVNEYLGVTNEGVLLFNCKVDAGLDTLSNSFSPPEWVKQHVLSLEKVSPFLLDHDAMHNADDLIPLRDGYTKLNK